MPNNPLISIIVPAFNAQKYLRECIESVIKQTYKNIEIIVIDDGSTDKTPEIARLLAKQDSRIKFFSKENGGVSSARNLGIKKSHGDFVFFIDSDDFIDPDCIEYYYNLIKASNADISVVPTPKKVKGTQTTFMVGSEGSPKIISGEQAILDMLYYKIVISSWGKMFSHKLIVDNNIRFNEVLAYGEGFSFSLACFQKAKKVVIGHKKVYNYRLDNTDSVMTKYKRRLVTDSLKAQEYIQSFIKSDSSDIQEALDYAYWHTCCDCLNTVIGSKTTKDQDLKKRLKKDIRRNSLKNLNKPIPRADKLKSILFFLSPTLASRLINSIRKRKFTKV